MVYEHIILENLGCWLHYKYKVYKHFVYAQKLHMYDKNIYNMHTYVYGIIYCLLKDKPGNCNAFNNIIFNTYVQEVDVQKIQNKMWCL